MEKNVTAAEPASADGGGREPSSERGIPAINPMEHETGAARKNRLNVIQTFGGRKTLMGKTPSFWNNSERDKQKSRNKNEQNVVEHFRGSAGWQARTKRVFRDYFTGIQVKREAMGGPMN